MSRTKRKPIEISNVCGKYGAPMGRPSDLLTGVCRIERMEMEDFAYDTGGAYWGAGDPDIGYMYVAEDDDGSQAFVRATGVEDAIEKLRDMSPGAEFLL